MIIKKTKFRGLLIIKQKNNNDKRGNLRETFNKRILKKKFVFEYCTTSKKNVLRGFHFQTKFKQSKYVNVVKGKILDVVIDLRKNSKTFGKTYKKILNSKKIDGLFIPKGFVHGLIALENDTAVINFCSNKYNPKKEFGINIRSIGLTLPKTKLFISNKDKNLPDLKKVIQKI